MTEKPPRPVVAIVGRPNVGKSTLFNRLVGKKMALVDDRPGVTRDRREGEGRLGDLDLVVVDTAGLEDSDPDSLAGRMRGMTEAALGDADIVLFMIDARAGVTPSDRHFAAVARRTGKPVVIVANKAEGPKGLMASYEAYGLGFGDPVPLSAEHGEGFADLAEAIMALLPDAGRPAPEVAAEDGEGGADKPLKVAVIGRPNAGKSTLLNALIGEERLLTGPEAGITRDSIAVDTTWNGRPVRVFDTAGIRRRARVEDKLEKLAVADALRAVKFAEVVVVLLDATIPFEKQDLALVDLVENEGRAVVVGLNKWDLVEGGAGKLKELREECWRLLPQVKGCPVVSVSGLTVTGLKQLGEAVFSAAEAWNRRISTGRLNRWIGAVLENHPPPAVSGRRIKIRYVTQVKARPPHFAVFGNQLDSLPESYRRYLVNAIRETFDLPGTPIRLSMRTGKNPYGS